MASTDEHTSAASAAASKSSFPVDALYSSKPYLPFAEASHHDEYKDVSHDMQSAQWLQVSLVSYCL